MAFALLSVISSRREVGITLPDLCKASGQDKRSAPARCKTLESAGLIKGTPVLAHKAHTTQYVHHRFLQENVELRESKADFTTSYDVVDLHKLRVSLSDALSSSTNNILKVNDLFRAVGMTKPQQASLQNRRRTRNELGQMTTAGYVRRVRVPGKQSGRFSTCYELLKPYKDTDKYSVHASSAELLEDEEDEDDGGHAVDDDLDMSRGKSEEDSSIHNEFLRNKLLENQIQEVIAKAGEVGEVSFQIGRNLFGSYWLRPFDECLKRMTPAASSNTQPAELADLGLAPPLNEIVGKTNQYRYRSASFMPDFEAGPTLGLFSKLLKGSISSSIALKDPVDRIERRGRGGGPGSTAGTKKRGRPRKDADAGNAPKKSRTSKDTTESPKIEVIEETVDQGQPVEVQASPSVALPLPTLDAVPRQTSTEPVARPSSKRHRTASPTQTTPEPNQGSPSVRSKNDMKLIQLHSGKRQLVPLPHRAPPTKREEGRAKAIQATAAQRKALLLQMLEERGGICLFDVDFIDAYDELFAKVSGMTQGADRATLRRSLQEMDTEGTIKWRAHTIPSSTSLPVRKDVFSLSAVDLEGPEMKNFVENLKARELTKRKVTIMRPSTDYPHIARPEMDMIPSKNEVIRLRKAMGDLDPSSLTEEELVNYRIRVAARSEADSGRSNYIGWYKGRDALPDPAVLKAKADAEAAKVKEAAKAAKLAKAERNKAAPKKPKLRRVTAKHTGRHVPATEPAPEDAMPPPAMPPPALPAQSKGQRHILPKPSDPQPEPSKSPERIKRTAKRVASKRADRFVDPDELEATTGGTPPARRRHLQFTDAQDDILVRAAALTMLFFSKSDIMANIRWEYIEACLPDVDASVLRARHNSMRTKGMNRLKATFIGSVTFTTLYNQAVLDGELEAVPEDLPSNFDLMPYVEFTRHFDPSYRLSSNPALPDTIDDFLQHYTMKPFNAKKPTRWHDEYHTNPSTVFRKDLLKANTLTIPKVTEVKHDNNADLLESAVKSVLLTAEVDYNADIGSAYAKRYGSIEAIEKATVSMLDRGLVIDVKGGSNRLIPGRNYELSDRVFKKLKSTVPKSLLTQAAAFEDHVKTAFDQGKNVLFPVLADNGTSAASVEMAIVRDAMLEPGHRGWTAKGLIDNYEVRKIEPHVVDYPIVLCKGLNTTPSEPILPPTVPDLPVFWVDIHNIIMETVYKQLVATIISHTIQRGAFVKPEFLRITQPYILRHELDVLMDDLTQRNIFKRSANVYVLSSHYYRAFK